jgi:hypothetical protein
MAPSSSRRAAVAVGSIAALLVACQAVIGLDKFTKDKMMCDFQDCAVDDASDAIVGMDSPVDYFGDANSPHRWVAWPMPNPADAETDANPATYGMAFEAGVDGGKVMVVRDLVTKLEWIVEPASSLSFTDAQKFCDGLGNSFRLPTRIELASLWSYTTKGPAFDKSVFGGGSGYYWTQSPALPDRMSAWSVDFGGGNVVPLAIAGTMAAVRCVR